MANYVTDANLKAYTKIVDGKISAVETVANRNAVDISNLENAVDIINGDKTVVFSTDWKIDATEQRLQKEIDNIIAGGVIYCTEQEMLETIFGQEVNG